MSQHLITTAVTGGLCNRCHTPILTGVAEGLLARVDLTPLNPTGEIHALIAGLQTYTLARSGLVRRDAGRIADTVLRRFGPVVPAHQCRRVIPAEHRAPAATPTMPPVTDACPF